MLALSLAFSCFTLTAAASVEGLPSEGEFDGLQIVGDDDVICSVPVDDGISLFSGDVDFNYNAASIQYYSAYLTGSLTSSANKTSYNFTSSVSSEGFANSSSLVNNGVMGYTTFSNLAPSASVPSMAYLSGSSLVRFLTYAASSGLSSGWASTSVPSISYLSYLEDKGSIVNGVSSTLQVSAPAYISCLDTVYMVMDITLPANSAYNLGNLNWEFDVGTSSSLDFYQLFTGSAFYNFDVNVYVDGSAIYMGSSSGNIFSSFSVVSGFQSLCNGSLFKLMGSQPYFLTNNTSSSKTFTVGVELVPVLLYQDFSDIVSVPGYGSNAWSFGRPCLIYYSKVNSSATSGSFGSSLSSSFPGFPQFVYYTSSNLPSSSLVSDETASALSRLSSNGYYYVLFLSSKSTEDIVAEGSEAIIDALNNIINQQQTIINTENSILSQLLQTVANQHTMITNQTNIYNTEKEILSTEQANLSVNQSIAGALMDNPYVIEFFDPTTGQTTSSTQNGLDDALIVQGNAVADATGRLAYMTGSDMDIGIKDGMSDREEAIADDFLGEDSKATFTKDDTGQLSDVSGEMKDMLNTGASAGDAFDSFSEVLGGDSEYSWFSSTTEQNLNPGSSTYFRDNYNYDYYYSNQDEVRRRLGLDG